MPALVGPTAPLSESRLWLGAKLASQTQMLRWKPLLSGRETAWPEASGPIGCAGRGNSDWVSGQVAAAQERWFVSRNSDWEEFSDIRPQLAKRH